MRRSTDPELSVDKMYALAKENHRGDSTGSNTLGSFEQNFRLLCQDDVTAGKESLGKFLLRRPRTSALHPGCATLVLLDRIPLKTGAAPTVPYLTFSTTTTQRTCGVTLPMYPTSGLIQSESPAAQEHRQLVLGKLRYEWMNRRVTSTNDDGINWQYMRLADVYLMAAEAINELEGPAAAAPYLSQSSTEHCWQRR